MKALFIACTASIALTAHATPCNILHLETFIEGNYTVIAQESNSNSTYSGIMSIQKSEDKIIRLVEKVPHQRRRIWLGHIREAAPGEGCVLEVESKQHKMSCLISSDLDNFARLTCITKSKKSPPTKLGLLALFPIK